MKINEQEALAFNDIILLPQYSEIESRSSINLESSLYTKSGKQFVFGLPLISSPMDTVTGPEMCYWMWQNGGLGILHRFCSIEEQVAMVKEAKQLEIRERGAAGSVSLAIIGAAIGANGDFLERARALVEVGVKVLCIDIAHGHSLVMKKALEVLVKEMPDFVHLMAGNIATREALNDLLLWGADSVRVGIGSGAACSTSMQTGHGLSLLQSLLNVCEGGIPSRCTIIADGGIKKGGDATKAFAAGANFCMLGSLLAGTKASPGQIVNQDGRYMKNYRGSASSSAQKDAGKTKIYEEGVSTLVPYTGKIENILERLENGIRSGLSYSGAKDLETFRNKVIAQRITNESYAQATPHILGVSR